MTWKSTAFVSGAMLLVGWLASAPPDPTPQSAATAASPPLRTAAAASDIEQQAERLQNQTRQRPVDYDAPERNLFRFGPKESANTEGRLRRPSGGEGAATAPPVDILPDPPPPPPPPITLSGVASDRDGDTSVRTAILSSPNGVLLVREGDQVLGQYRVGTIGEASIELTRLSDGTLLRLSLK